MSPALRWTLLIVAAVTAVRFVFLIFQTIPLSVDEAQYWGWAQDFAFGYFSKPPLLAWIIAATTSLCGDGESCIRIAMPLLHLGTALLVFTMGRVLFDERTGAWAAALYIFMPAVGVSAVIASTDAPLVLFWALALVCLVHAGKTGDGRWWAGLGCAIGLGLLTKYTMAFFALGMIVYAIWARPHWPMRGIVLTAAVAFVLYLPNLVWNIASGFVSYGHTLRNMNLEGPLFQPKAMVEFLVEQLAVFGPISFAALLVACVAVSRRTLTNSEKFLLSFILPVLVLMTAQALLSRAYANWALTAYVAGSVLVTAWLLETGRQFWLKLAVAIHVTAMAIVPNLDLILAQLDIPMRRGWDAAMGSRGWDQAGAWAGALKERYPDAVFLFDDRVVMAEMIYYVRPHPFDAVMWNPLRRNDNHYEMTTDAMAHVGRDFIYVTRGHWIRDPQGAFASTASLGTFEASAYAGHLLRLEAMHLGGFKGYQP